MNEDEETHTAIPHDSGMSNQTDVSSDGGEAAVGTADPSTSQDHSSVVLSSQDLPAERCSGDELAHAPTPSRLVKQHLLTTNRGLAEDPASQLMKSEEEEFREGNAFREDELKNGDNYNEDKLKTGRVEGGKEGEALASFLPTANRNVSDDHSTRRLEEFRKDDRFLSEDRSRNHPSASLKTSPPMSHSSASSDDYNRWLGTASQTVKAAESGEAGSLTRSLAPITSSSDSSGKDDALAECAWAKGDDPWEVVDNQELRNLDIGDVKTVLWLAGLLSHSEYCRFNAHSGSIPKAEHAKSLLKILQDRSDKLQTFTKFIEILSTLPKGRVLAKKLWQRAVAASSKTKYAGIDWPKLLNLLAQHADGIRVCRSLAFQLELAEEASNDIIVKLQKKYKDDLAAITTELFEMWLLKTPNLTNIDRYHQLLGILCDLNQSKMSETLQRKVSQHLQLKGEQDGTASHGYIVQPLVTATIRKDDSFGVTVEESTVSNLRKWYTASCNHPAKTMTGGVDQGVSELDQHSQSGNRIQDSPTPQTTLPPAAGRAENGEKAEDSNQPNSNETKYSRSKAGILTDRVIPPDDCLGARDGDVEVILLCGEKSKIKHWLSVNKVLSDKELGKLDSREISTSSKSADGKLAGSRIVCLLPREASSRRRLYFILRLHPTEPDDLLQFLIRMSIDITPSWLIFYSQQSIQDERFLVMSTPGSYYSTRGTFRLSTDPQPFVSLLTRLRFVFDQFRCRASPEKDIPVLHIHYVFDVAKDYFESAMVKTSNIATGTQQAVCAKKTIELFVRDQDHSAKEAKQHAKQHVPFVKVGVSLLSQLSSSAIVGHKVLLSLLLPKLVGFVPTVLLTSQGIDPAESLVGVREQEAFPGVVSWPSDCKPSGRHRKPSFSQLTKLMDSLVSPHLNNVLASWHGQVQVVTAIGSNGKDGADFLDKIAGSALTSWLNQTARNQQGTADAQKSPEEETPTDSKKPKSVRPRAQSFTEAQSLQKPKKGYASLQHGTPSQTAKLKTSLGSSPGSASLTTVAVAVAGAGKLTKSKAVTAAQKSEAVQGSPQTPKRTGSVRNGVPVGQTPSSISQSPNIASITSLGGTAQQPLGQSVSIQTPEQLGHQQKALSLERKHQSFSKFPRAPSVCDEYNPQTAGDDVSLVSQQQDGTEVDDEVWAEESVYPSSIADSSFIEGYELEGESSESKLWITFRPSQSTLYVLLAFQGFAGLAESGLPAQTRALLLSATALANIFIFPLDRVRFNIVNRPLPWLAASLRFFRQLQKDMPSELFRAILVPTIMPKSGTSGKPQHLTPHFGHLTEFEEAAKKYGLSAVGLGFFADMQKACEVSRFGHIRQIMSRYDHNYSSGLDFLDKLKFIVAMTTLNQRENLELQSFLDRECTTTIDAVMSTLSGVNAGHAPQRAEQVHVDINDRPTAITPDLLAIQLDVSQQVATGIGNAKSDRRQVIRKVVQFITAQHTLIVEHPSHKELEPEYVFKLVQGVVECLMRHRVGTCRLFEEDLCNDSGLQQQYERLVTTFWQKWTFCGKRCTQFKDSSGDNCHYLCLLPRGHLGDSHDCLDCSTEGLCHHCESVCTLCLRETRGGKLSRASPADGQSSQLCTKSAGHQHTADTADRSNARLHKCDHEHRCRQACVWAGALNCGLTTENDGTPGTCCKRLDHVDGDGDEAVCVCHISQEDHRCPMLCEHCTDDALCEHGFHLWDPHAVHACKREHFCKSMCTQPGICLTSDISDNVPDGAEKADNTHAWTLPCTCLLSNESLEHSMDGGHTCGQQHQCNQRCPRCLKEGKVVFCTEIFNHELFTANEQFSTGYVGVGVLNSELSKGHHFNCGCRHDCESDCPIFCNNGQRCRKPCVKELGHSPDVECSCGSEHLCGKECSVDSCSRPCILDVINGHDSPCRCDSKHCLHSCSNENCLEMCINGHDHDLPEDECLLAHHCGGSHTCHGLCKSPGVCKLVSESHGVDCSLDQSEHLLSKTARTARCAVPIEPGKVSHSLPCRCELEDEDHLCTEVCPQCRHSCEERFGHMEEKHQCQHGKIQQGDPLQTWVAIAGGRESATVDAVSAANQTELTCQEACLRAGRGHVHARLVMSEETDVDKAVQSSNVEVISHDKYYSCVNTFADPCAGQNEEFGLCSKVCPNSTEEEEGGFCQCPVLHEGVPPSDDNNSCWDDGHLFTCSHRCKEPCKFADLMDSGENGGCMDFVCDTALCLCSSKPNKESAQTCPSLCDRGCNGHMHPPGIHQCAKVFGHTGPCKCSAELHQNEKHACPSLCPAGCDTRCAISCEDHVDQHGDSVENWKHDCKASATCCRNCNAESDCLRPCVLPHMHSLDGYGSDVHHCGYHKPEDKNKMCDHRCQLPGVCSHSAEESDASCEESVVNGKAKCEVNHWWGANPRLEHECYVPADEHTCEERCPLCKAFCHNFREHDSQHDSQRHSQHDRQHNVQHSEVQPGIYDSIRWGENFKPFELTKATACANVCKIAGRRHFHKIRCPGPTECSELIRQCDGKRIHGNADWDYVSHNTYWEAVKINDPCDGHLDEEVKACPAVCHPECKNSYCSLELFHDPKAPRSVSDNVHDDRVKGGKLTHLLRGHEFKACPKECASSDNKCEYDGCSKPCCLLKGHNELTLSVGDKSHLFQISQHVCEEHSLKLCERDICPMCHSSCEREEHSLESTHWCRHQKVKTFRLAEQVRTRLLVGHQRPAVSKIQQHGCAEICQLLGEAHHHWVRQCTEPDGVDCLCHTSESDSDSASQHSSRRSRSEEKKEAKHHKNKQFDSLPCDRYWKHAQWESPSLTPQRIVGIVADSSSYRQSSAARKQDHQPSRSHMTNGSSRSLSHDMTYGCTRSRSHDMTSGSARSLSHDMTNGNARSLSHDMTSGSARSLSHDMTSGSARVGHEHDCLSYL